MRTQRLCVSLLCEKVIFHPPATPLAHRPLWPRGAPIRTLPSSGTQVLFDTRQDKPVAFKYGGRPFQSIVCEGVEEGLKGMKAGSKRRLIVPAALAPKGLELPPGVPIVYEIEVTEVLPGYF